MRMPCARASQSPGSLSPCVLCNFDEAHKVTAIASGSLHPGAGGLPPWPARLGPCIRLIIDILCATPRQRHPGAAPTMVEVATRGPSFSKGASPRLLGEGHLGGGPKRPRLLCPGTCHCRMVGACRSTCPITTVSTPLLASTTPCSPLCETRLIYGTSATAESHFDRVELVHMYSIDRVAADAFDDCSVYARPTETTPVPAKH